MGVPNQGSATSSRSCASFSEEFQFGLPSLRAARLAPWRLGRDVTDFNFDFTESCWPTRRRRTSASRRSTRAVRSPTSSPASFVKLREVTLSKELPSKWAGWLAARSGLLSKPRGCSDRPQPALLVTRTPGWTPRSACSATRRHPAQDVSPYPTSRSFFFSLDLGL